MKAMHQLGFHIDDICFLSLIVTFRSPRLVCIFKLPSKKRSTHVVNMKGRNDHITGTSRNQYYHPFLFTCTLEDSLEIHTKLKIIFLDVLSSLSREGGRYEHIRLVSGTGCNPKRVLPGMISFCQR